MRHFRFTQIHFAWYCVEPLLGNKILKSFKEAVCVSRNSFQVLRQNCNLFLLYDTIWDKMTNVFILTAEICRLRDKKLVSRVLL